MQQEIIKAAIDDIDGLPPSEISKLDLIPPFHGRPYAKGTELYTNEGWKEVQLLSCNEMFLSPNPNNNLGLEWVGAKRLIKHDPKGFMYEFKSQNFHLLVDKEHSQIYSTQPYSKGRWKIGEAQELTKFAKIYIPRECKWAGENKPFIHVGKYRLSTRLFVQFMAFWLSDGSVAKRGSNSYQISIANTKNNSRIFNIVKQLPFKVRRTAAKIEFNDTTIGKYLIKFGHAHSKCIPEEIKQLTSEYLKIFLESYLICDGHIQNRNGSKIVKSSNCSPARVFYTTSRRLADDIGECILKTDGYPSYIMQYQAGTKRVIKGHRMNCNHDIHRIYWNRSKAATFGPQGKGTITKVPYLGMAYCIELKKSHGLLVRYNGKVCISMNCRCQIVSMGAVGGPRVPSIPKRR